MVSECFKLRIYLHRANVRMKCMDIHKHVSLHVVWAFYHDRQMSLSGFKGARDRCFPHISKETFCWLFALIIFIRILLGSNTCQQSLTGRKTKVKQINLSLFYFLRCTVVLMVCQLIDELGVRRLLF